MNRRAFTLIEVMVVVAILSIMASMMLPAVWKWWENEEIAITKERMAAIKKGLIGNKDIVQGGIQSSYGFVGDNGIFPNITSSGQLELRYLVSKPASGYPFWNGPYLSGFGDDWYKDAWGKNFRFSTQLDSFGRYIIDFRSAGADGIFNTIDDVPNVASGTYNELFITEQEAEPVNKIRGNFQIGFINMTGASLSNVNYSAKIVIEYRDAIGSPATGVSVTDPICKNYSTTLMPNENRQPTFHNFSSTLKDSGVTRNMPVSRITIRSSLYKDADCNTIAQYVGDIFYYVNSGNPVINVNLPPMYSEFP